MIVGQTRHAADAGRWADILQNNSKENVKIVNGAVAQIVALVAHGNLFLSGKDVDLSTNSTLQYISSIKFVRYKSSQDAQGVEVANSVSEWFSFLRSAKATRLWHVDFRSRQRQGIPAYIASAFVGGIQNAIQADLPEGFELWFPQWETTGLIHAGRKSVKQERAHHHKTTLQKLSLLLCRIFRCRGSRNRASPAAPKSPEEAGGEDKSKPWSVEYRGFMSSNSYALPMQEMSAVKNRLRQAVSRAKEFAQGTIWTKYFAGSLEALESPAPVFPFGDMLPSSGFPLEARQLLAAAAQAYVFGGMSSWNDLALPNDPEIIKEYEEISTELYDAIQYAIVMASNAFTA